MRRRPRIPMSVLVIVLMLAAIPPLAWYEPLRPTVILPICVLLSCLPWAGSDIGNRVWSGERARFMAGLCVRCGYDLRAGGHERCPECGAGVWTPDMPLVWPADFWPATRWIWQLLSERDVLTWMLERRGPTPADAWGDDDRVQRLAALVIGVCQPTTPAEPYAAFRPQDAFSMISSMTTVKEFAVAIHSEIGVALTLADLAPYEAMTLGEVVNDLAGRSNVVPPLTWKPRTRRDVLTVARASGRTATRQAHSQGSPQ